MKKAICLLAIVMLELLISCGYTNEKLTVEDIEIFKDTPAWDLAKALDKSDFKKAKETLSAGSDDLVNYQDPIFGTTLLMRAVSTEQYKAVRFLLENGAEPDIISGTGTTALFRAIAHPWNDTGVNENSSFVEVLLQNGADPNIPYCAPKSDSVTSPIECGTSPLMYAVQRGIDMVKLLVEYGAKINYKTELGTTAAIKALLNENVEVAHYLIVEKEANVKEPYYYYDLKNNNKINYGKPHMPISLLEKWLYPLGSEKHQLKMEIVDEFERQGQNYWAMQKHPKTIERIKKIYPDNWQEYLQKY
jgi:ankyrin repeat protein